MNEQLEKCGNRLCKRLVRIGIVYCCANCALAEKFSYEVDEHSKACNSRHEARGEAQ